MWTTDFPFTPEQITETGALTEAASGILLGRATYEMFGPAWSQRTVEDDPGAPFFNDTPKHVVSASLTDGEAVWRNSTAIGGYDAAAISTLKERESGDLYVSGSATPVRSLLADGLADELHAVVAEDPFGSAAQELYVAVGRSNTELADELAREMVEARPDDPEAWVKLGNLQRAWDLRDDARESFERAMELEPEHHEAMTRLNEMDAEDAAGG